MDLGKLSFWYRRAKERASNFTQLMIVYLFLKESGWQWWYLVIIFLFCIFMMFDIKYILPKETEYGFTRSETFRRLI